MKKWIVTISAAFSTLDLFWKDRIEKRPDSAKEEEMFGGKIRIRKVHNYGFALGTAGCLRSAICVFFGIFLM